MTESDSSMVLKLQVTHFKEWLNRSEGWNLIEQCKFVSGTEEVNREMYVCYHFYYKNEQVLSKKKNQRVQTNSRQFFTADRSGVTFPA